MTEVYTPSTLAERWQCSERQVRKMISEGELRAFRLGGKLLRIRREDVEAIECQTGDLQDCEANSASHGTSRTEHGADTGSEQQTRKRRLDGHLRSLPN